MKRLLIILSAALFCFSLNAADLTGKRIYVNPGHGSFGPNDRPMATIPYPNLPTTGMPDTCGFYESNTNLWKCLYLGERLQEAGAYVMYSRKKNGPWPYQKVNGDYPDYTREAYYALDDYEKYNRPLSEICEEVEANNMDLFISVHSNALTDGTTSNYPLYLYRGYTTPKDEFETTSKAIGTVTWPYRWEMFAAGFDVASSYSATNMNIRGDIDFYGSSSTRHSAVSGKDYTGYLGVLKHGTVGGLWEGYFHTYQPGRHRALNPDYCKMEGYSYYRGIVDYFNADKDTKGYIIGTVKDLHEKIVNKLFNYAPNTNDQWLPCNGAVVTLYKGGREIAKYDVDNNYNGIFYFGDLEPGEDYSLNAVCEGYNPLYKEYKEPFSVTANTVTYKFLYLEDEDYEAPAVVYSDYPDPLQPSYLGLAGKYEFKQTYTDHAFDFLAGKTVHRVVVKDASNAFILAIDSSNVATIYQIDPTNRTLIAEVPTTTTQGSLRNIGDIAIAADGVLMACNYSENQYDDSQVAGGNTQVRGTFRVYKWADLAAEPEEVFTSLYSANWYRGNIGNAMAISGTSTDFSMLVTCPTISSTGVLRLVNYLVTDGKLVATMRNQDPSGSPVLSLPNYGWEMQIKPSPLHDKAFMLIGDQTGVTEINLTSDAQAPQYLGKTGFVANGASFFKYAKHVIMVATEELTEGEEHKYLTKLYDVTNGLENAKPVEVINGDILMSKAENYVYSAATVLQEDITILVAKDGTLSRLTTIGQEQPATPHINAYALNMSFNESQREYTFTYTANSDAEATNIVFYQEGFEVGKTSIPAAKKGENTVVIKQSELPIYSGSEAIWAIELDGSAVANWGKLHNQKVSELGIVRGFISIDNNPESEYFQRMYIYDRAGANNAASGLHAFNQEYDRINTQVLKGGRATYGSPYRSYVDDQGYIWMSDGSDGYSGVIVANPADLEGTFEEFFDFDNRDKDGILTKNGVELGSSVLGLSVYGTGKDTKLLVYNEDKGNTLGEFTILTYDIGTEEGTYKHQWSEAPSGRFDIAGQAAWDGYPLGTTHGFWVAQRRSAGQNNASATALKFYSWDGREQLSSHSDEYKDIINGCMSGAIAMNPDESELIMIDGSKNLLVFDLTWEGDKPILKLRYSYNCGIGDIREMHFDYAGNLVTSGTETFTVFTIPTEFNHTVVPARKSLVVTNGSTSTEVEGVVIDKKELLLNRGESYTLKHLVMPVAAVDKSVTWTTSNADAVSVSDGVVSAVATGEADITVTTTTGNFSAICHVKVVTPVTGVALDITEKEVHIGETFSLNATITPADADNTTIIWKTSDPKVARVIDGDVTARKVGEAIITVTTEDGGYTATCKVTVKPIAVTGVSLDNNSLELIEGETATLVATVAPDDATNKTVSWTSSNDAVATVADGLVTAVEAGDAVITVTTADGEFTATCAVKVTKAPVHVTGVSLNETSVEIEEGKTITLVATIEPAEADNKNVTWQSSNDAVATVADGLVTAIAAGDAVITVTTEDGEFQATCAVTVKLVNGVEQLEVNGIYYRGGIIYNENNLDLQVYNLNGQLVATGNGNIDMNNTQPGVYIVRHGEFGMKIMK